MVRVPESRLDYYFHVGNVSLGGMALLTWSTEGFPFNEESVLDIEVYSHRGSLQCRGVVARVIPCGSEGSQGFGVKIYHMAEGSQERWADLVHESEKWGSA